jgi:chemotaxis protein MotB
MRKATFLCALALSGCSGAQLKELRDRNTALGRQIVDKDKDLEALQARTKDLEGQVSDLEDKLKAAQIRIDDLAKSNKDLSESKEAGQGELSAKIKQLVAEKDELSRKLNDLQREKIVGDRLKTRLLAKRDAELAAVKQDLDASKGADKKKDEERSARLAKAHDELGTVADAMLKPLQGDRASISQEGEAIVVTLQEPLLFEAQRAKLSEEGAGLLDRLGGAIHKLPARLVRVQAHSDNAEIKWDLLGRFTSHWDLTAARATAVARYLHEHSGLDPRSLVAEGYGEFRPIKPNDSAEGRAANRRVVLVLEPAR